LSAPKEDPGKPDVTTHFPYSTINRVLQLQLKARLVETRDFCEVWALEDGRQFTLPRPVGRNQDREEVFDAELIFDFLGRILLYKNKQIPLSQAKEVMRAVLKKHKR